MPVTSPRIGVAEPSLIEDGGIGMAMLAISSAWFRDNGARYWHGRALEMQGLGAEAAGDLTQARAYGRQALQAWTGRRTKEQERVTA